MNEHPRIEVYGRMLGCIAVNTAGRSRVNAGNRMHTSGCSMSKAASGRQRTTSETLGHSCYM